jgi:hypothetical protein
VVLHVRGGYVQLGATDGLVKLLCRCHGLRLQHMSHQAIPAVQPHPVGVVALVGRCISAVNKDDSNAKTLFKPESVSSSQAREPRWEQRLRRAHACSIYKGVRGARMAPALPHHPIHMHTC